MNAFALVFLGGGLGSVLRLAVYRLASAWMPEGFAWGTLIVNVAGGLAIGGLAGWFAAREVVPQAAGLFLLTGLIGGFTTFSAFSLEAVMLWQRGAQSAAALYVVASVLLSLAATIAGLAAARALG
ncbi:MAG: fluoride efflux transporter CrcB [Sphingomicrobium sp.]